MRVLRWMGVVGLAAFVLSAPPAFADQPGPAGPERVLLGDRDHDHDHDGNHDKAKELIKVTIRVLETRVGELERTMAFDSHEAGELSNHAQIRDRSGDAMAAKAKEFRAAMAKLPQNDPIRAELDTIATTLETDASHDHDFATQRRNAAKVLTDQAAQAKEWIRLDKASIDHYKSLL